MKKIMVIHSPASDSIQREAAALESVNGEISRQAESLGIACEFFSGNSEGELVTAVQSALAMDGVILNAAGYASYSIAIRDAISSINKPVVEVRTDDAHDGKSGQISMISPVCAGSISGFGACCYILALYALADKLGVKALLK